MIIIITYSHCSSKYAYAYLLENRIDYVIIIVVAPQNVYFLPSMSYCHYTTD